MKKMGLQRSAKDRQSKLKFNPQSRIYKSFRLNGEVVVERTHARTLGVTLIAALLWSAFYCVSNLMLMPLEPVVLGGLGMAVMVPGVLGQQIFSSVFRLKRVVLNRTELRYEEETPLRKQVKVVFKTADIANVYVDAGPPGYYKAARILALKVLLKNGQSKHLCTTRFLEDAYYIEKVLERHMNLTDRAELDRVSGVQG